MNSGLKTGLQIIGVAVVASAAINVGMFLVTSVATTYKMIKFKHEMAKKIKEGKIIEFEGEYFEVLEVKDV